MQLKVTVNGVVYEVEVEVEEEARPTLGSIFMGGGYVAQHATTPASDGNGGGGDGVKAPLSGSVARVLVDEGQEIEAGEVLVVLEAMKMETEITAPTGGVVSAVLVAPGDAVSGGQVLVELAPPAA
ncbi:MAG: biotin/lipoyl-binding protein [Nocardioidaceae bacterium]|nr:biotin/lipoyl-binding protein [Nocardioidaceae bacterium]